MDGVVGPGLRGSPEAGGGEVDAEGAGGAVGGQYFDEAIAKLRKGGSEGVQAGEGGHAGKVEGVAGGVASAFEGCWLFAAEGESGGSEEESAGKYWGRRALVVMEVGWRGRCDGLDGDVAGDQGRCAGAGVDEAGVGDPHLALPWG